MSYDFRQAESAVIAAETAENTTAIAAIKEELIDITGNEIIEITEADKYIDLNGTSVEIDSETKKPTGAVDSTIGFNYAIVECSSGDIFTINGTGAKSARLWGFVDADGLILAVSGSGVSATDSVITAPENSAWLIINDNSDSTSFKGLKINQNLNAVRAKLSVIEDDVSDLNDAVFEMTTEDESVTLTPMTGTSTYCYWLSDVTEAYMGCYIRKGNSDSVTIRGFEAIQVSAGEKFKLHTRNQSSTRCPYYAFVDENYNAVSYECDTTSGWKTVEITAPERAAYLLINCSDSSVESATLTKEKIVKTAKVSSEISELNAAVFEDVEKYQSIELDKKTSDDTEKPYCYWLFDDSTPSVGGLVRTAKSDTVEFQGFEPVSVECGNVFNLYTYCTSSTRVPFYAFVDADYNAVSYEIPTTKGSVNKDIEVPENAAYLLINAAYDYADSTTLSKMYTEKAIRLESHEEVETLTAEFDNEIANAAASVSYATVENPSYNPAYTVIPKMVKMEADVYTQDAGTSDNPCTIVQGMCSDHKRYLYWAGKASNNDAKPCRMRKWDTLLNKSAGFYAVDTAIYGHANDTCFVPANMAGFDSGTVDRIYVVGLASATEDKGTVYVVDADTLEYITEFDTADVVAGTAAAGAMTCCENRGMFAILTSPYTDEDDTRCRCLATFDDGGTLINSCKWSQTGTASGIECDENYIYLTFQGGFALVFDWDLNQVIVDSSAKVVNFDFTAMPEDYRWEFEGIAFIGNTCYASLNGASGTTARSDGLIIARGNVIRKHFISNS